MELTSIEKKTLLVAIEKSINRLERNPNNNDRVEILKGIKEKI